MFLLRTYYRLKPFMPHGLRLAFRRWRAGRRQRAFAHEWPIKPGTEKKPAGWKGWPNGKKFALVLTHDVERAGGLERCRALAELEMARGFRSAFNFVPEGDYQVSPEFREFLTSHGFEVGVHDLKHDGKLYWSREVFRRHAEGINHYLRAWQASGFRSGFMHHNLEWLHDLEVQYDASTFDTDPFEPQPDGVDTIFPFWVSAPGRPGYVELPYTLAQDFTLFLLLQEEGIDIWKKKLDWIAEHGGMAMLDVHPDYMDLTGPGEPGQSYSIQRYAEFLDYARQKYDGQFWSALPKEVAAHARAQLAPASAPAPAAAHVHGSAAPSPTKTARRQKIWIDLDNTPHVPFFEPIIEQLRARGFDVVLTARDAFQVCDLADQKGLRYTKVGRHYGKNKLVKVAGLFYRAFQLLPFAWREKPDLALSHGARSQIIISNLLRIPTVLMADYEFAQYPPLMRPTWEMVPEVIPNEALCCVPERVRKYPGIKEDVYVSRMRRDPHFLDGLGIRSHEMLITVRPPATEAHYHNPESEQLFVRFMELACAEKDVRVVLLPRNTRQGEHIRKNWPQWFGADRTIIPRTAVDGLNLLWYSDLVVSGGGTMNREAAALGVPVYSIFRGKTGAIDHHLQQEGRLVMIENLHDVEHKIRITRRHRDHHVNGATARALGVVVHHIDDIARLHAN
jgi:predicted glycosyltransferase